MNISDFKIQILIVFAAVVLLWLFFKILKLIWKVIFICLVVLILLIASPGVHEWISKFF